MSETSATDTDLARESRRNGVVLILVGLVFAVLCYHWARLAGVPAPIPPAAQPLAARMMDPPPPLPIAPGALPPTVVVRYLEGGTEPLPLSLSGLSTVIAYLRSHPDTRIVLRAPSIEGLDEKRTVLLRERLINEVGLSPDTFVTEAVGTSDARMVPPSARNWVTVEARPPQR
ncbi:MAG TPA: hypothetical protein VFK82_07995 [Burkholderiaceae bacterium]|nr:hypothetical protein [Burkholderiaceae bacterium]